jgi:hypothetical protein
VTRAGEPAGELPLPLANAVARHIDSLRTDDGEGLLAASAEYRALGDRAAAADVAAQAAVALSRKQERKRSLMPRRWRSSWPPTAVGCARRRCETRWANH